MLINVFKKINKPLLGSDFINIIHYLIQSDYGYLNSKKIEEKPYDELKPMLNEKYSLRFIGSIEINRSYGPQEIISILAHLYQYSHVSSLEDVAALQPQPYVITSLDKDGKYILKYETFHVYVKTWNNIHIDDPKFISEPIEFIEKPCFINVDLNKPNNSEIAALLSCEKCDQYLAFHAMIRENQPPSTATTAADKTNRGGTQEQNRATSFLPNFDKTIKIPSSITETTTTTTQQSISATNKTAQSIISKLYWVGYYYYGTGQSNPGRYNFHGILEDQNKIKIPNVV